MGARQVKAKRKICVVTGSRADYGHLYWVLKHLQDDPSIQLQLVVTGMHLSAKYGSTYKVIENDGFPIEEKVRILKYPDTDVGVTKSVGLACQKFADTLQRLQPDILLVLGDRYEVFAASIAAYVAKIVIAHIHGGESAEGVMDEAFRHGITKMATIHFPVTELYRRRVIQLGEQPERVFHFGTPGLDHVKKTPLFSKNKLSDMLGFDKDGKVALVTYHPVTLEKEKPTEQVKTLLQALDTFDFQVIFTKSNADPYGASIINEMVGTFCQKNPKKYKLVDSLGQQRYYSCLNAFDMMIGNSSSGLLEAPAFKLPVINIGDRQKNRVKAANIIDTGYAKDDIQKGIRKALSKRFKDSIVDLKNPYDLYGDGKTSYRVKQVLKKFKITKNIFKKDFYNSPWVNEVV